MNKAIFLDRDGVLNLDKEYIYKIEDLVIVPGIIDGLKPLTSKGYKLIIVTNQSGIERGYYTEKDFWKFNNTLTDLLKSNGIEITATYFCPKKYDNIRRKPAPGMILEAAAKYNIDLKKSFMIGDKDIDIECGINAGIGKTIRYYTSQYKKSIEADITLTKLEDLYKVIQANE